MPIGIDALARLNLWNARTGHWCALPRCWLPGLHSGQWVTQLWPLLPARQLALVAANIWWHRQHSLWEMEEEVPYYKDYAVLFALYIIIGWLIGKEKRGKVWKIPTWPKFLVRSTVFSWTSELGRAVKISMWEWADPPSSCLKLFTLFPFFKKRLR